MNRRSFLESSLWGAAVAAQAAPAPQPAPSDRVVLGVIGTGDLGTKHHITRKLLPNPRVEIAAVCDVDDDHSALAAGLIRQNRDKRPGVYHDFRRLVERKDIDAVLIATPDHWHTLTAIAAMQAGKDVYCEKPLSLTIEEGRHMVGAARRYNRVLQTGSQQRSDKRFHQACELVRNGKIGKLERVTTHIGDVDEGKWQEARTAPPNLDWNLWLGPAPFADYRPNRCHYQFRWYWDYSGGKMTDWGAHHNDIAQWGLGMDESGPVSVRGEGKISEEGPHEVFLEFQVWYKYANGVELVCQSAGENGVRFFGVDGWIFVNRDKIEASNPDILKIEPGANDRRLYVSRDHHENFLDCVKSRQRCAADVEIGHRSATVCHIGNIAMRLGRELKWDPAKEQFIGDDTANLMTSKPMRAPWRLS